MSIRIKIYNPFQGKNQHTFFPLLVHMNRMKDYGIEISDSFDSYDFLFIGNNEYMFKNLPLSESVELGLTNLQRITENSDDVFLFDGSDSTSLKGAIEVLEGSNAMFLFKNQLLSDKILYSHPTTLGRYFWNTWSGDTTSYNISDETWGKIKLSGYNLGYYRDYSPKENNSKRSIDVCAIYQSKHKENYEFGERNDEYYTNHRSLPKPYLENHSSDISYRFDKLPYDQYIKTLRKSKLALSPFGMGEVCYRDFELMQNDVCMIKPTMGLVDTYPNPYIADQTYIPVNLDWSNLIDVIRDTLDNKNYKDISWMFQNTFVNLYNADSLCYYWYNIFLNLPQIKILNNE